MRDQTSLRNFMENRPCLVEDEKAFAYEKEDLITLRPGRDHSFVDGFVERMLKIFHCRLLRVGGLNVVKPRWIELISYSSFSALK